MKIQTYDSRSRIRDATRLGNHFNRVVRDAIFASVPANEISKGDMGVRLTGTSYSADEVQAFTEKVVRSFDLLSPNELAIVKAVCERYGGNPPNNAAGISAATNTSTNDAINGLRSIRQNAAEHASMQKANDTFWDKQWDQTKQHLNGR